MRRPPYRVLLAIFLGATALGIFTHPMFLGQPLAQGQKKTAQDEPVKNADDDVLQPILHFAKSYNTRDLKALTAVWAEKGEYLDEDTGDRLVGRKAIVDDLAEQLGKGVEIRLEIDISRVRRLGAAAASIEGTTQVFKPKTPVARTKFLALLVRQDGKWLIHDVRESRIEGENPNADRLAPLAWLDGSWKFEDGDREVTMECTKVANGNFRTHRFQVKSKGEILHEGTQVIGWDAVRSQYRSWVFSSDGSFGEGMIENKGDRWILRVVGTLPSGEKSSASQIVTRKDANHFTYESTDRSVGTNALPDVSAITLTKVGSTEKGN